MVGITKPNVGRWINNQILLPVEPIRYQPSQFNTTPPQQEQNDPSSHNRTDQSPNHQAPFNQNCSPILAPQTSISAASSPQTHNSHSAHNLQAHISQPIQTNENYNQLNPFPTHITPIPQQAENSSIIVPTHQSNQLNLHPLYPSETSMHPLLNPHSGLWTNPQQAIGVQQVISGVYSFPATQGYPTHVGTASNSTVTTPRVNDRTSKRRAVEATRMSSPPPS